MRSDLPGDPARNHPTHLEKDPRHRLHTARDVSNEFRDLSRQSFSSLSLIAPFVASCGLEAFADGITEESITGLSRFA